MIKNEISRLLDLFVRREVSFDELVSHLSGMITDAFIVGGGFTIIVIAFLKTITDAIG